MANLTRREPLLFIGSYTGGGGDGIRVFRFDSATGLPVPLFVAGDAPEASFLALHPNGRVLYAVHELSEFEGESQGAVGAYAVDAATGALTLLNRRGTGGASPCHVSVHPSGRMALVANYAGGSVAAFPLEADGRLGARTGLIRHAGKGKDPIRQEGPHAHCLLPHPSGSWALAVDLGLDRVLPYRIDLSASALDPGPAPAILPAGTGPRHLAFHPAGRAAYLVNELEPSLSVFDFDDVTGQLRWIQDAPLLPEGARGPSYGAEVRVHPSGRFLYASNRGHDSLAVFTLDASGRVSPSGHASSGGVFPRHFGIDPSGSFLVAANQKSGSLAVFRIDPATGVLARAGGDVAIASPVCAVFANPP